MTDLQHAPEVIVNPEDNVHLPWDPLREQDWTSLGVEPSDDVSWEMMCDGGMSATGGDILSDDDHHNGSRLQPKVCLQFSPVAVDTVADCFWDNLGFTLPSGNAKHFAGPQDENNGRQLGAKSSAYASSLQNSISKPGQPASHDSDMSAASTSYSGGTPPDSFDFQDSDSILPAIPDSDSALLNNHDIVLGDMCAQGCPPNSSLFVVQLYVTAIADGKILPDVSVKTRGVLEQVRRKVSKEQNTVVQVKNEGAVDLKMRVFVANSLEAGAVAEYIAAHPNQTPAPFVVLSQQLHMAVSYDPSTINPSVASVADRLRKQIKTHAVKVLRESINDARCNVTTAMLRGHRGAAAPAAPIAPIVEARAVSVGAEGEPKCVVLPAKSKPPPRDEKPAPAPSPKAPPRAPPAPLSLVTAGLSPSWSPAAAAAAAASGASTTAVPSPEASAPSTPLQREELDEAQELRLSAHFPVNLFVTAIADGAIAPDTPHKVQERLGQIVRKVPKEQNTSVEVCEGQTIDLKMRVFVVNSEDAKAVGDYIHQHLDQLPAPFVVLARHLPMAVLYDPNSLDLGDASVADRLRKQAKTRAVKVLREAIANKQLGVSMAMLRGHEGALAPAEQLHDALQGLTQPIAHAAKDDPSAMGKFVVFAARNKACSLPCSPRKRNAAEMAGAEAHGGGGAEAGCGAPLSPRMRGGAGAGGRRTGVSSASCLHRDMLDKVLKKGRRDTPGDPAAEAAGEAL